MDFMYFDLSHAIQVHDDLIDKSGGANGILYIGLLEATLEHVQITFIIQR